jgi:signal transduction histidine kinase
MKGKVMRNAVVLAAMAAVAFAGQAAWAAEKGTAKEAEALVKKGIAFIKANGKDKGYAEITSRQGQFVDRDLYLIVLNADGMMLANGANAKLVGLNRMDSKTIDGKFAVRDMIEAAKTKNGTWTEYKYSDPTTKKFQDKANYCEHLEADVLVCGGYYKP